MTERRDRSPEVLKRRLCPQQYRVTQETGTEPAFTGEFHAHEASGRRVCVCCGSELLSSSSKYDSGSGWPSFCAAVERSLTIREDRRHGMLRNEVLCAHCGTHLGHLLPDGPRPAGQRYCINSAALDFDPGAAD